MSDKILSLPKEFVPGFSTNKKPTIPVEIDQQYKNAHVWLGNSLFDRDTKTGQQLTVYSGAPEIDVNKDGLAYSFNAVGTATTNPVLKLLSSLSDIIGTKNVTILIVRTVKDTTNRASTLFGNMQYSTGRCGTHAPYSDGNVYFDFGGSTGSNRLIWTGYSKDVNILEKWIFKAGDAGMQIWFNGELVASSSTAVTRTADADVLLLGDGQGSDGMKGDLFDVNLFALFPEEIGNAECKQLTQTPYQILKPQIDTFYFPAAAGGGTITGAGAPQATTGTASASGTVTGIVTGSGTVQAGTATSSGVGLCLVSSTGTPQATEATSSGAGLILIAGSGSPQAETATANGTGQVGNTVSGSGTPSANPATSNSAGLILIQGNGSPQAETSTSTAVGITLISGTGSPQSDTATSSGTGQAGNTVSGSGVIQAEPATSSGVGLTLIIGTGSGQSNTATASGDGEIIGAVSGSGTATSQTANSTGAGLILIAGSGSPHSETATASGYDIATTIHPGRVYTVDAENRVYTVEAEDRVYNVG